MTMNTAIVVLVVMLILLAVSIIMFFVLLHRSRVREEEKKAAAPDAGGDLSLSRGVRETVASFRNVLPGGRPDTRVPWILLIGESGSGKTTLTEHLGSGVSELPAQGGGVRWNVLDGGILIDVPGNFLIGAEGRDQPDGRWNRLIRSLLRHRPARPVDGVVLTIPASELLRNNDVANVQRSATAAAIRAKLDEAQRLLGLVVPIYVLVTRCDQVRGFGSFCWEMNPDMDDDMFGWSNPNTLESAFSPDWVDEAFDMIEAGVLRQQMRVFGSRAWTPATDELFLFPLEFAAMRAPMRSFLNEVFRETAYVDSNFPRGIYFCGDASVVVDRLAASRVSTPPAMGITAPTLPVPSWIPPRIGAVAPAMLLGAPPRRQIAFAKHLFDFKVFLESKIARPVARVRFTRNRAVLTLQAALAVFVVVFSIGSVTAYRRLLDMRDHKFFPLLTTLADKVSSGRAPTVQTAYDLVDSLGDINTRGFRSLFLPASWRDPIDRRMSEGLTDALRTVVPAVQVGLDAKANEVIGDCTAVAALNPVSDQPAGPFSELSFERDPQYVALDQFLKRDTDLENAVAHYESIRRVGGGTYKDLDAIFQYLLPGRALVNAARISQSEYYERALSQVSSDPLTVVRDGHLDSCTAERVQALAENFYTSWFTNNPLLSRTTGVADELDSLRAGRLATDDLPTLVDDIRSLDGEISGNAARWLTQTEFDPSLYPALKQLPARKFATPEFIQGVNRDGHDKLTELREQLFMTRSGADPILEQRGEDLRVSAPIMALEIGIEALRTQDFMTSVSSLTPSSNVVTWNLTTLGQATQLRESYEKFIRDRMPLLPPGLRPPVQRIAAQNLSLAVNSAVARAQGPVAGTDDTATLLAVRSFKDAAPVLTQLQQSMTQIQQSLPPSSTFSRSNFQSILANEGVALAQRLNRDLAGEPAYTHSTPAMRTWNGSTPLSHAIFASVDSQDALEEFLSSQRERIHSLAVDYAEPLAAYLQSQALETQASFNRWLGIIGDVKDYDAKKAGNSIAALETFIRTNLDKITPVNACRASDSMAGTNRNDYFVQIRADLQNAAVTQCSQIALRGYTTEIAAFFNSKLAGKFPFGNLPATSGVAQADPHDVSEFLSRVADRGPGIANFLKQRSGNADILSFLDQADAVRQMFAGGLAEGAPYADVAVTFRVNQNAERSGNEIIDWEFKCADQSVHFPGGTENGVRWHYGDPVHLAVRYAKDSPDVPRAGGETGANARVDGRSVTWDYTGAWSLFALLASHGNQTSDFGETAEALPGMLRFAIPTIPEPPTVKGARIPAGEAGETRVFIRLAMRVPGAKEVREVPIAAFPTKAPLPAGTGSTE
ncbi:MAG TPA: type VI secretion protein IcmF/TssM N-terminal domain-containing protein [Bryobacteraceae bacterium]|jgi:type VI secretion system protein ImpL|nr:type VI secretion protein IcmF/TssM N-terminal domain-containing protein [Bryobacteraceae bacterium]